MRRRFRRHPPLWFWLALAAAAALVGRNWMHRAGEDPGPPPDEAVVASVIDGRTLEVVARKADPPARLRLLGIEIVDGAHAEQWLATNLLQQSVRVERDKRRRAHDSAWLAYVFLGDTLVNAELIRHGWARHDPYPGDSESYARQLRAASVK